jgi:anti-anti-sigma factor
VIEVSGELDISTAPELSQAIQEVVDPELDRIELDCADLRFLDSTGLSVIMAAWKALNGRSSQPVVLRNARPAVERVLRVAGLDDLLIEH